MNKGLFDRASDLYRQKDYQGALQCFTACLQDATAPLAPGELGLLYHRIGNCLVKLKNPAEAIQAYTQSTVDRSYPALSTVKCNIGMAYASLRDYENAVLNFEAAVSDPACDAPYKAYMGMGSALMKLGKSAEAGVAFREAALDVSNPDPTRALLNLGVCFMALNRPLDAVSSYESALQFGMQPDTRNKLYASLGQAYAAAGQMEKAVESFERALADQTYLLSDSASVDYQRAVAAVAQRGAEKTQVLDLADVSGLDIAADGAMIYDEAPQDPFYYDEGYDGDMGAYPGYVDAYNGSDDRFFNASDAELEQWSRGLAKQDRKRRNVGLKILVALIIVLVLALAAAVVAYTQGFGYPTQQAVAEQLFADPEAAKSTVFATSARSETVDSMVDQMVKDPNIVVDGVNRTMTDSTVFVTAHAEGGAEITYRVSMVRDMIGWKVSNVELYFPSQN